VAKTTTHSEDRLIPLNQRSPTSPSYIMLLKDFNEKLKENEDMQNSYVSLHRTLDTTIQNLESQINPNHAFITDLKKKKLQLKEHIDLGKPLPRGAHSKLASMLHSHKVNEKMKRKQRKIAKHAYDEELKRQLQKLSN